LRNCFPIEKDKLVTITCSGEVSYWDLSSICRPEKIKTEQLTPLNSFIRQALKIDNHLVLFMHMNFDHKENNRDSKKFPVFLGIYHLDSLQCVQLQEFS